jgi:hypothetical protein
VRIDVTPRLPDRELAALEQALARAGTRLGHVPDAYVSAWRRAAAREATRNEPARYTPSPRSTRGATRA